MAIKQIAKCITPNCEFQSEDLEAIELHLDENLGHLIVSAVVK